MEPIPAFARALIEEHPLDAARVLERYETETAWSTLADLDTDGAAALLEGMTPPFAARTLQEAPHDAQVRLVAALPPEVATDLLPYLPDEVAERVLAAVAPARAATIHDLAGYDEDSAGGIMSPEAVALPEALTVRETLTRLRRLTMVGRPVSYVYVVDDDERLTGVLLMRDLALALPTTPLAEVMLTEVASVRVDDPLERVADVLLERGLLAVPVVDDGGRLRGVVSGSQLATELQEDGFEDVQKMFGAGSDEHVSSPATFALRKRLPWLQVNLATAFLAAAVIGGFDAVIAELTVLAALLPVVAGQAGNAGAQALAVMLRALALDELAGAPPLRLLGKEALVGAINGLATGVSAAVVVWLVTGLPALAVVVAVAMTINLAVAGAAGAAIPLLMHRLGQDPAQSSNIMLTTVTDVVGFASFLGLALLARPYLF